MPLFNLRGAGAGTHYHRTAIIVLVIAVALLVAVPAVAFGSGSSSGAKLVLTLSKSTSTAGEYITVTAQTSPKTKYAKITLKSYDEWNEWVTYDTLTTDKSGKVSWDVRANRNTSFKASWRKSSHETIYSNTKCLSVKAKVTVRCTPGEYQSGKGTTVVISGTCVPRYDGGKVKIYVYKGWHCVTSFSVPLLPARGDSSKFTITKNLVGPGTFDITAKVDGGKHADFLPGSGTCSITL